MGNRVIVSNSVVKNFFFAIKAKQFSLNSNLFVIFVSLLFGFVFNYPVVSKIITLSLENGDGYFSFTAPLLLSAAFAIIFSVLTLPYLTKIIFSFLIITSSLASYATLNYGIIFDYSMMENVFETNVSEASSYISISSVAYFLLLGLLPTLLLWLVRFTRVPQLKIHLLQRLAIVFASLAIILIIFATCYKDYASVGRNNSYLNKLIVPAHVYYTGRYINKTYLTEPLKHKSVGLDAKFESANNGKPELLVLVLGETARSMNIDMNGYQRATTPYTDDFDLISLKQVSSCGTATAHSVPCMFSNLTRQKYNRRVANAQDNVLDIIQRAGVSVLWKENDGGDKGVAKNVHKIEINSQDYPQLCDSGVCLDATLLENFDAQVANAAGHNQLLVVHIMGSHGPTYWKRYPSDMAKFAPACERADIENCSDQEIINTYDNTLVYTDYIVSEFIKKLKAYDTDYNVGLMYLSDHGESLGENGLYLHGTPYALAPKEQTTVPWMIWLSDNYSKNYNLDVKCLKSQIDKPWSHDNLFHTLLDFSNITTQDKDDTLSVFNGCRQ